MTNVTNLYLYFFLKLLILWDDLKFSLKGLLVTKLIRRCGDHFLCDRKITLRLTW